MMKLSVKELAVKRMAAKEMIVEQGMNQREVAKQLGISERSISIWVRKDKWKELIQKQAEKQALHVALIDGFMDYLELQMPQVHREVQKHWGKYMKTMEAEKVKAMK